MDNKDIPVCTLFKETEETQDDVSPVASDLLESIQTQENMDTSAIQTSDAPTSPVVCNIFQNTPSSEDLFSSIQQTVVSDESQMEKNEQNDDLFTSTECLETNQPPETDLFDNEANNLSDGNSELLLSDNSSHEDTNNNTNITTTVESEMMTSIMIHDEGSFENISNLSLDQSSKEDDGGDDGKQEHEAETIKILESVEEKTRQLEITKVEDVKIVKTESPQTEVEVSTTNIVTTADTCTISESVNDEATLTSTLFSSTPVTNLFNDISSGQQFTNNTDDAFTNALTSSEFDRRKDAWIPGEATQTVLAAVAQSQKRITLESNHLVKPGLGTSESQGDPIQAVLARYKGNEFIERNTITVNNVTPDKQGLKELIDTGNFRAAVDLCGKVLTNLGQGFGQQTQESLHTPETLEWWHVRLALLVRLKAFELAENEISLFGNFDSADLYFGFYPDLYPGRQGSIVPFSLRLLHAEFPKHMSKPGESIARLHAMIDVCNQIVDNLSDGKTEVGLPAKLKPDDRNASMELWKDRKIQILYAIGNSLIQFQEYQAAIKTYDEIMKLKPSDKISLQSGIGRAFLQLGDIKSAQLRFADVEKEVGNDPDHMLQLYMNRGFLYLGANKWDEALQQFGEALKIAPHNLEVLNNKAVCLLYLCRLKDAIATLESAINITSESDAESTRITTQHQPITFEGALNNLVTLYELESTRSFAKKQMLLQQMALTVGDGFDVTCLKM